MNVTPLNKEVSVLALINQMPEDAIDAFLDEEEKLFITE